MTNQRKSVPLKKWAEAEALWANGDATRKEIAKKLGVSESAVQQ
ncbi:winged helix-turn-helix transcriptional regulator, partial [Acinetobacter baumannii]